MLCIFDDNDIRVFELRPNKNAQNLAENRYPYVTHQMAMKWLREVYDVYIDISIYVIAKNILKYNIVVYYKKHKNDSMYLAIRLTKECSKYEDAVEAALIYVLENLLTFKIKEES